MWKDNITVRVQARFRKLRADHGVPLLQKCKRAREILEEIYGDRELCITENLIRRAAWLCGFHPWHPDEFYTVLYEQGIIHRRLEAMVDSVEVTEPEEPPVPVPPEQIPEREAELAAPETGPAELTGEPLVTAENA